MKKSVTSDRRVGRVDEWASIDDVFDPRLGLGDEQLRSVLEVVGASERFLTPDDFKALRSATLTTASDLLRNMTSLRASLAGVLRGLVGACAVDWMDENVVWPSPYPELNVAWRQVTEDRTVGFGGGEAGFARLHRDLVAHGPCPADVRLQSDPPLKLHSPHDWQSFNAFCKLAAKRGGKTWHLPVRILTKFFASARVVAVAGVDEPVELPSLLQLLAIAIAVGPDHLVGSGSEFVGREANREVGKRRDRRKGGKLAAASVRNIADDIYTVMLRIHEIARGYGEPLNHWRARPARIDADEAAELVEWTRETCAVPPVDYRRAHQRLIAAVDRHRHPDGSLDRFAFLALRDALLWNLLATAARIGEVHNVSVTGYLPSHTVGPHTSPAIVLTAVKKRRFVQFIRPITAETAKLLEEWIAYSDAHRHPDLNIWVRHVPDEKSSRSNPTPRDQAARLRRQSLSRRIAGGADSKPIVPRRALRVEGLTDVDQAGHGPHAVRHLVDQLAVRVGVALVEARPEAQTRVSPAVYADGFLEHKFRPEDHRLGYSDLQINRDRIAWDALLGDPELCVPGVYNLLFGEAGARHGWDLATIRSAHRALLRAEADLRLAEVNLARRVDERDAIASRPLPRIPRELLEPSEVDGRADERSRLLLLRDEAREAREQDLHGAIRLVQTMRMPIKTTR